MYRNIIVPVDLGQMDKGEKILKMAMSLRDEGGVITLLNVAEVVPSYIVVDLPADFIETNARDAEQRLKRLNQDCGANATVAVRTGYPAREILSAAEELQADLILVGSHRPNMSNYLLGSTAERVVRHATCSVLVDR